MSAISLKSITGITSITTPAGVDNQLTLHTNDTTQRVKVTESGVDVTGVVTARSNVEISDYIKHLGDTNTMIGFPSNDSFSVTTNNVTRMTFTGNFIDLPDAGTFRFGGSNDLQIYHGSGGASNIVHSNTSQPLNISATGTGNISLLTNSTERLRITPTGLNVTGITTIRNASGTKLYEGASNGSKLFHAGTERLSTELYGIDINGTLGADQVNCSGIVTATAFVSTAGQLSNRNKIQNGAMNVSQRFETDAHTPSSTSRIYTLDRWAYWSNQASKTTIQQVVDAPVGFRYSSKCTVASAYSISSGDWFGYMTHIEGQDLYDLELGNSNAKAFTLSFYVKSSVAGTWAAAVRTRGSSPDHSYPYNYTINSANTWEKKTITIPGPTSGTWVAGRGEGMCVWFDLGSGSAYHATANQWHSANRTGPSASPFIANAGATWQITGVQLEKGSVATEYEHRSAADETSICERYCEVIYGEALDETNEGVMGVGHFYQSARLIGSYQFHTQKRVGHNGETSDYGIRNTGGYVKGDVADVQGLNSGASWGNSNSVKFRMNRSACRVDLRGLSGTQGHAGEWRVQNSTKLIFSAEFG